MAKKSAVSSVKPVRQLDPAWKVKFKSAEELANDKKAVNPKPAKINSANYKK